MPTRLTDTTIWKKQKWFKKLPVLYKLAWKYLTDECNHVGIWKIDYSELTEDLGIEDFDLQDFISACNKDYDKKTGSRIHRQRIMPVGDSYLWLTGFLTFQYGNKAGLINTKNNTLKSIVQTLQTFDLLEFGLNNKYFCFDVPLGEIKAFEKGDKGASTSFKGLEGGERGNSIGKGNSNSSFLKKETIKEDNTISDKYWFLKFYHSSYDNYKSVFNGQSSSPEMFAQWKFFIDFIYEKKFEDIFECKFISPHDFEKLMKKEDFPKEKWENVLKKILSTGIKPEHNLFFRIPEFIKIVYNGNYNKKATGNTGREVEFDKP